jgi:hypothetical protein
MWQGCIDLTLGKQLQSHTTKCNSHTGLVDLRNILTTTAV